MGGFFTVASVLLASNWRGWRTTLSLPKEPRPHRQPRRCTPGAGGRGAAPAARVGGGGEAGEGGRCTARAVSREDRPGVASARPPPFAPVLLGRLPAHDFRQPGERENESAEARENAFAAASRGGSGAPTGSGPQRASLVSPRSEPPSRLRGCGAAHQGPRIRPRQPPGTRRRRLRCP